MAIAFARMEIVSRSSGGSATRTAAYIHRERVQDSRTGERFDFRHQAQGGDAHGVVLPDHAPAWMRDPAKLWDAAEQAENRKNSQTAYHVVVALPKPSDGLSTEDHRALVEGFVRDQWVRHNLAASWAIHPPHEGEDNWHAHILISTRRVTEQGFGAKARDLNPTFSKGANGLYVDGQHWGKVWAEHQNTYFRDQGLDLRVDGAGLVTQEHLGPKRHRAPAEAGVQQDRAEAEAQTFTAWRDPEAVPVLMTRNRSTFTLEELDRDLAKALPIEEERAAVRAAVLESIAIVRIRDPEDPETLRWTTRAVLAEEEGVLRDVEVIGRKRFDVDAWHLEAAVASRTLRPDQLVAVRGVMAAGGVAVVMGRAGVGKSYAIGAMSEAYRRAGYTVVGLGPTNLVGQELAADKNIARGGTLHSELWHVEQGKRHWDGRTVVIVDEAAMVDTPTMARLTAAARAAGAKLVLVGDERQLSSVERGGMFAKLGEQHQAGEISVVTRQRGWQKLAAEDLAAGRHDVALKAFNDRGFVRWSATQDEARAALVGQWAADGAADPSKSAFVFAYTNADVDALNRDLRAVRQERRELGPDVTLQTDRGPEAYAVGDRVQITKTLKSAGLVNGQVGTVERIHGGRLVIREDGGKLLSLPSDFTGFRHGYAGTIYKGQGRTIDRTYLYHSHHWRSAASYVALTRQRETATVFVATDTAKNLKVLSRQMARADDRRAATAYKTELQWQTDRAYAAADAEEELRDHHADWRAAAAAGDNQAAGAALLARSAAVVRLAELAGQARVHQVEADILAREVTARATRAAAHPQPSSPRAPAPPPPSPRAVSPVLAGLHQAVQGGQLAPALSQALSKALERPQPLETAYELRELAKRLRGHEVKVAAYHGDRRQHTMAVVEADEQVMTADNRLQGLLQVASADPAGDRAQIDAMSLQELHLYREDAQALVPKLRGGLVLGRHERDAAWSAVAQIYEAAVAHKQARAGQVAARGALEAFDRGAKPVVEASKAMPGVVQQLGGTAWQNPSDVLNGVAQRIEQAATVQDIQRADIPAAYRADLLAQEDDQGHEME